MSCGIITQGAETECDDIPEAGTRARLVLMNYDEVDEILIEEGRVVDIMMASGKVAYEFTGFRNDVQKSEEVAEKDGLKNRFRHALQFVVYDDTQEQKTNLENVAKGRFIAITERLGKGPDALEVLGKDVGLEIKVATIRDAYENGGLFVIALNTPDNGDEFEQYLPKSFGYGYIDGQTKIDLLLGGEPSEGVFDDTFDDTFA